MRWFWIRCKMEFFVPSCSKSPCDGIGGTVKRKLYRESLTRVVAGSHILTSQATFDGEKIWTGHDCYLLEQRVSTCSFQMTSVSFHISGHLRTVPKLAGTWSFFFGWRLCVFVFWWLVNGLDVLSALVLTKMKFWWTLLVNGLDVLSALVLTKMKFWWTLCTTLLVH